MAAQGLTDLHQRAPRAQTQSHHGDVQLVMRDTGYAIVSAEGFETVDEVVFAEPGDMALLGVRTLGGFGVMVDNIAHRFVATTTIVAANSGRQTLVVPSQTTIGDTQKA